MPAHQCASTELHAKRRVAPWWVTGLALGLASSTAHAQEHTDGIQAVTLRLDNDMFAGADRGYSNGTEIGLVTATVDDYQDQRLPAAARWINSGLVWLQPKGQAQYNMVMTLGQGIFTPTDWRTRELVEDDRPYAGVLLLGVDYNGRNDDTMQTTTLNAGMIGPSARAAETQRAVHKLIGSEPFEGWDNQLKDEFVFRIIHQRYFRRSFKYEDAGSWSKDLIVRGGGSLGNLATFANAGAEFRFGPFLPDNFGSAPSLPAAENTAPTRNWSPTTGLHAHGFVALDVRAVAYDVTLDGNIRKSSHSVDKRPIVMDVGAGVAVTYQRWKVAFARYFRTREFEGQESSPELGSLTIRYDLQ